MIHNPGFLKLVEQAVEDRPWVCRATTGHRPQTVQRYYVSKPVYEADIVVNMSVIKTHRFAE